MTPKDQAESMAQYVQGAILGSLGKVLPSLRQPTSVRQEFDGEGFYRPYFLVTLASGIVLRVQVTVESVPDELPADAPAEDRAR